MGNVSTDQKLQLARLIRAQDQDNRMKMRSRERMLYGVSPKNEKFESEELPLYAKNYEKELCALENSGEAAVGVSFSSFKLRLILAVMLFAGFLILDAGGGAVAGITTNEVKEEINKDFDTGLDSIIFDFEHNFPYTLFSSTEGKE